MKEVYKFGLDMTHIWNTNLGLYGQIETKVISMCIFYIIPFPLQRVHYRGSHSHYPIHLNIYKNRTPI
jgi:hypothetical protein